MNTKWYKTAAVAKAVRHHSNTINSHRSADGDTDYVVADTAATRKITKAYDLAMKGGRVAEALGVEWATVQRRLGLRVLPEMLIAAQVGMPYEWASSPLAEEAIAALAEINEAFPPKRS